MKKVPFYPNRADNYSCFLACLRSALEYFSSKRYSYKELERITGYKPGKVAWTVKTWTELAGQGFDILMIEGFNYELYAKEGEKYLRSFLLPEGLEWQLKNSNLLEIRPLLPKFLKDVKRELRSPNLTDIDVMLDDGFLVFVMLNLNILNNEPGYAAHSVLVYDKNERDFIAHDPGLPPHSSRQIPRELLFKAMGGVNNTVEVTGLKLKNVK